MFTLFLKEIRSFLNSLIGYIVICVFLLTISLFMWVIPFQTNILDAGYANIDTLFTMAPWVFMFLIPAITMRSFADEKSSGTIELLQTKPLSDLQIILSKYGAGLALVIFSLLPTLIYYVSVHQLGMPPGNIDSGSAMGSYLGLLFLGSGFVAIGIFASAISNNQIVSFIIAIFLSWFLFEGFERISSLNIFGSLDTLVINLGILEHYRSMSRGVLDTRDIIYFLSFDALFIMITKTVLHSRKWS